MSYPPPPGLKPSSKPSSTSTTPVNNSSLPPRPPAPAGPTPSFKSSTSNTPSFSSAPGTRGYGNGNGDGSSSRPPAKFPTFTGFQPRSVASNSQPFRTHSPIVSAGPAPPSAFTAPQNTYSNNTYQAQPSNQSYNQNSGYQEQYDNAPPKILNPFPLPGQGGEGRGYGRDQDVDPEMEAQIAQWQSAYMARDSDSTRPPYRPLGSIPGGATSTGANSAPLGTRPDAAASSISATAHTDTGVASVVTGADGKQKTVVRSGGGQTWQDPSLLEWDPAHFRLFVGNLAGEVTDDSLLKAFSKYPSVQKARVVRDKRTTKSRGFGFVSFADGEEYFQAARDMQGKYIGSHPVLLRKSTTEIRPTVPQDRKGKGGKGSGGGKGNGGGGIQKKQAKTKGGLKVLG